MESRTAQLEALYYHSVEAEDEDTDELHCSGSAHSIDSDNAELSDGYKDEAGQGASLSTQGRGQKRKRKQSFELYTPDEEYAVRRKLDVRLVGFVAVLYALSFLDRSNIGNAQLAGLSRDLGISDAQFTALLRAFYITYILFEWMTLLYRMLPAHAYIASCVLSWGLIASMQALATGFWGMLICRLLLGTAEAAFGPGIPFYLSFFYRRHELAYRVGLFISAAPLASCFASSLAYAITRWGDTTTFQSWRLLFLVEGFPSVLVAVWAWWWIPDEPGTARWLNARERRVAEARVRQRDIGKSVHSHSKHAKRLDWGDVVSTLRDPKSYLTAGMFFSCNIAFSSMPVFEPMVVKSMGYSSTVAQGLSALPHLSAFFAVLIFSHLSDRHRSRSLFIIPVAILSMLGYVLLALAPSLHLAPLVKYICLFPITAGFFTAVTLTIVWTLDNQTSSSSKGTGVALLNVVGQMGPLVGTGLYPERDKPNYTPGHATCAAFMGAVAVLALLLRLVLARKDSAQRQTEYEMVRTSGAENNDDYDDNEHTGEREQTRSETRFEYIL
ncbi:MFS general substrate transporter [Myriangium duriaei CBS 260.36]|uniref:MFS general substrate transporter n=1 Tax=Myriangium duriaei CBS 260.36 TaxID=1168546 RepID=A0A9P4J9A0_9PEZI|nr:MFS general substrate transporter [Myriangium duriaei CBS 260.36]